MVVDALRHPQSECARQADLADPTSLPAALVGINAVVDCATARPEESTQKVDWQGKVSLIQCAQVSLSPPSLFLQILIFRAGQQGMPFIAHGVGAGERVSLGSADELHIKQSMHGDEVGA